MILQQKAQAAEPPPVVKKKKKEWIVGHETKVGVLQPDHGACDPHPPGI